MRCSITWIGVALMCLTAMTGCGSVWDRVVLDPLRGPSGTLPHGVYYYDASMAPTPASTFTNSPGDRYGSSPAASLASGSAADAGDASHKQ